VIVERLVKYLSAAIRAIEHVVVLAGDYGSWRAWHSGKLACGAANPAAGNVR
jgi:hypothetical protein